MILSLYYLFIFFFWVLTLFISDRFIRQISLIFSFLILILSVGFIVLGLWKEDVPITMLGDFGLYFFGLYTLFYGINGMKDPVTTWGIGIIVLGIAFYISIRAGMEYLNELN